MTRTASVIATAIRLGLATLAAGTANTVIALTASTLDKGGIGMGLTPAAYLPATVFGILAGATGWNLIIRRAPKALRVVVPLVLFLSWIPDVLLLTMGATIANVVGLMLMHTVITTAVVVALRPAKHHEPAQPAQRPARQW